MTLKKWKEPYVYIEIAETMKEYLEPIPKIDRIIACWFLTISDSA